MDRRIWLLLFFAAASRAQSPDTSDWGYYGGDIFAQRYSSLAEIDRDNVSQLAVAWQFRTGERGDAFEVTPVLAFGSLFLTTPASSVIALDPATGKQRWRFDPHIDRAYRSALASSRGVSIWEDSNASAECARRIFLTTADARLIALNAQTGQPCRTFGQAGVVHVKEALPPQGTEKSRVAMPPALIAGLVVVNFTSGYVGAFDVRTGAARWAFQAAAASATMSVDPDRSLLFAPSSNTLLALNATTGKLVWQQELIHADLWGFDLAAQPALLDLAPNGSPVPVVLQATRTGMLFAFERGSGKPFFPVVEQRVPVSRESGVRASPTQPFPVTPSLVAQHRLEPEHGWGVMFWDRSQCRKALKRHRNEGIYTPPDSSGAIFWPSPMSGVGWGGVAFDARRQRLFAAVNHMPMLMTSDGMRPLVSPFGLPCAPPPWGTLASVDLSKNRIIWQVPLGSSGEVGPWFAPARNFGTPNMAGPIVTAGDLVFIGAAADNYLRAFDVETGRELWKHRLPAGGQATPMTYRSGSTQRQFVVIAAGGHAALNTPRGDYVIAFALPR
jgi:quinoprotein glucose dehydrogenase